MRPLKCKQTLEQLRSEIDDIDSRILELMKTRIMIALQMGDLKKEQGRVVRDTARETQVLERLVELNSQSEPRLSDEDLRTLYSHLMTICLKVQK